MKQRLPEILRSTFVFGILLFVFAVGFPPFDDIAEIDLTAHMLQHVLIIISGVLISYPTLGRRLMNRGTSPLPPQVGLIASAVALVFWHLPGAWDSAVINPVIHTVEHLSFLGVGMLAGSWLLLISDSGKIGALLAAFFGHMGYAVLLISPWNVRLYTLYSLGDQIILGWVLLLTGPLLVVGIAYVVARNPGWLEGFSGGTAPRGKRDTILNRARVPRFLAPVLSLLIVAVIVGYFAATAYALGSPHGAPTGLIVYIDETPVSWQYSPQTVKVVLGVNATVTWVSRSISYDTVTDLEGGFSSGPIAPGQSFTHTFVAPGEYRYFCQYHPWMTGTVTVLSKGQ